MSESRLVTALMYRSKLQNQHSFQLKKYEDRWRFKGYYPNIPSALKRIVTSELLVNKQEVSDLNSHLKAVDSSNQMVLEAIDKLLDHKKCSGCQQQVCNINRIQKNKPKGLFFLSQNRDTHTLYTRTRRSMPGKQNLIK